jgi:gamma-glutamyl:cysteine ligase YbdK (ATP-grasp superfamily)
VVPSGPTLVDTVANLVFYVALTEGLKSLAQELTRVPFATLEADFYRAAREGLDARLHWPDGRDMPASQLLTELALPLARDSLEKAGIEDFERWLDIIEARVRAGATGARWISQHWQKYGDGARLVREYIAQSDSGRPVHEWRDPGT